MLSMKFPNLFLRPEIINTFLWGWELSGGGGGGGWGAGATLLSAEFWFFIFVILDTKVPLVFQSNL